MVPCYNETNRLHLLRDALREFAGGWSGKVECVIVDDGSRDRTFEMAQEMLEPLQRPGFRVEVRQLAQNEGKGGAIRAGVLAAKGNYILTMDADIATHPLQLQEWLEELPERTFPSNTVLIGNRKHQGSRIKVKGLRKFLGGLYNTFIRTITPIREKDTQCGFKLYPAELGKRAFEDLKVKGWAHDLEVLLKVHLMGGNIQSMPVDWHHVDGEKISVFKDGIKMVFSAIRISFLVRKDRALVRKLKAYREERS